MVNLWQKARLVQTTIICFVILIGSLTAVANASLGVAVSPEMVTASTGSYTLSCDLKTGMWSALWAGLPRSSSFNDVQCGAMLRNGDIVESTKYDQHVCTTGDIKKITTPFGEGVSITVHHYLAGQPEIRQNFEVYYKLPYFLTSITLVSQAPISSNHMTVVSCDSSQTATSGAHLGSDSVPQTLSTPYDNDDFVRYSSTGGKSSYELSAFYDNVSRNGFVVGSVTHDTWKTGLTFDNISSGRVGSVTVFGGVADKNTRDTQPHGFVSGRSLMSPVVLVGWFSDWRDGLETYGQANAKIHPPLTWNGGVPFGWNSWMAYESKISEAEYVGIADFFKNSLEPHGFSNKGKVYINLDSYWDNMSDQQIKAAVDHIHGNGQLAGIYWTPFVDWSSVMSQTVEGTDSAYKYQDIVLHGADGTPLPRWDGAAALDPTNPGTLKRIDFELARFVALGFDYIKLDFLSHGAMEGVHYNPQVTTGEQAYTIGMQRIVSDLSLKRIGRPMFISLSIAPLFPSGFGDSRRIACDTWGWLANSEYLLNSLSYGWWEEGSLYRFNDPDNVELIEKSPLTTEDEGRTRLNASVISGTVLLDSDPLVEPEAQRRALLFLINPEINALARTGIAFKPVEGDTGSQANTSFVFDDHKTGSFYVAVFNFDGHNSKTITLNLQRLGLSSSTSYRVHDLWSHQESVASGTLTLSLLPAQSTIVRLTKADARGTSGVASGQIVH